jgi:hypothetical protein
MDYTVIDAVTGNSLAEDQFNHTAQKRVAESALPDGQKVVVTMPATGRDTVVTVGRLRERLARQDWFLWDESRA